MRPEEEYAAALDQLGRLESKNYLDGFAVGLSVHPDSSGIAWRWTRGLVPAYVDGYRYGRSFLSATGTLWGTPEGEALQRAAEFRSSRL